MILRPHDLTTTVRKTGNGCVEVYHPGLWEVKKYILYLFIYLFRKGQTPHKSLYSSSLAPMQLFLKLLDTPIGSTTRDREVGIGKFLIFLSQRLFYFTCSGKFCGEKSDGLQPYEFIRFLFGTLETQAKKAVLDAPATLVYADVDEWIRLCKKMAEWIAFVIQEAWSQEFVSVIDLLACQFSSALVEGADITLKHIDEVLGTVMQKHTTEHDFFISDPNRSQLRVAHAVQL